MRILELTETFSIHRESVIIPLATEEKGNITILPDGHLRIVCPNNAEFDPWMSDLRAQLEKLDLSRVTRH